MHILFVSADPRHKLWTRIFQWFLLCSMTSNSVHRCSKHSLNDFNKLGRDWLSLIPWKQVLLWELYDEKCSSLIVIGSLTVKGLTQLYKGSPHQVATSWAVWSVYMAEFFDTQAWMSIKCIFAHVVGWTPPLILCGVHIVKGFLVIHLLCHLWPLPCIGMTIGDHSSLPCKPTPGLPHQLTLNNIFCTLLTHCSWCAYWSLPHQQATEYLDTGYVQNYW